MLQPALLCSVFGGPDASGNTALVHCWLSMPDTATLLALSLTRQHTLVGISPRVTPTHPLASTCDFTIRWFLAGKEIQRCGHGTLAAAAYIHHYRTQAEASSQSSTKPNTPALHFHSAQGEVLTSDQKHPQAGTQIYGLQLEAAEFSPHNSTRPSTIPSIIQALSAHETSAQSTFIDSWLQTKKPQGYTLVKLHSEHAVSTFTLNHSMITALGADALIICALSDDHQYDIVFRYFAPAYGIVEDSATGSAAPILYAFWQKQLHKSTIITRQLSTAGGIMTISADNHNSATLAYINVSGAVVIHHCTSA